MNSNRRDEQFAVTLFAVLLFNAITMQPSHSLSLEEVHLVRCLTHISHTYFAPGRPLVISSPSTYRDVQQELIAEIHRTAVWPVVVTVDGKITETDCRDKYDSYIILIPDGNLNTLVAEIMGLFVGRNGLKRFWNFDSRFVVAGAIKLSMSQQNYMFTLLSLLRIYNCIIVSLEHDVTDTEYSRPETFNDVDTGLKLAVYSWFPYQSSDRCDNVHDITILDSWVIYGHGHFTNNTDLFPRKIGSSFNGCPMKAFVLYGYTKYTNTFTSEMNSFMAVLMKLLGLEVKLLKTVLQQMNMTLLVTNSNGIRPNEHQLGFALKSMFEKRQHIYIGVELHTKNLLHLFDTTSVYYMLNSNWYVPCAVKYPRWSSIYKILSVELWVVLIISIVTVAISTTLVGRYSGTLEWQGYKSLANTLTDVWAVILGVGVSSMPRTPSVRSLFLAWVCFSIAFNTVFQAFLTTFLVDSGYKPPIQSMDELFSSGMKLAYPPVVSNIFEDGNETEILNVRRNKANCPSFSICFKWAVQEHNVSLFLQDVYFELFQDFLSLIHKKVKRTFCRIDDGVFLNSESVMIMFYGDPLLKRVNEILDRMVEAGIYKYWVSQLTNQHKALFRKASINIQPEEYYHFNLYHMEPAFHILLMGLCLSGFCFVIEVIFYRLLNKRK